MTSFNISFQSGTKVTKEQAERVYTKIQEVFAKFLTKEQCQKLASMPLTFRKDMKVVAGTASRSFKIEINEQLFLQNEEDFFNTTIPHEACHIVQFIKYPNAKQAHGPEWKNLMRMIGSDPSRCHNYDVTAFLSNRVIYKCRCEGKLFQLTKRMHNTIQNGSRRICTTCKSGVYFVDTSKSS